MRGVRVRRLPLAKRGVAAVVVAAVREVVERVLGVELVGAAALPDDEGYAADEAGDDSAGDTNTGHDGYRHV